MDITLIPEKREHWTWREERELARLAETPRGE